MKPKVEPQQVSDKEIAILLELLKSSADVNGDVVEFGCYRGDTSLLLARFLEQTTKSRQKSSNNRANLTQNQRSEALSSVQKYLWLYDSFEGLPEKTNEDNSVAGDNFKAGELLVTKREVVERFKKAGLKIPRIRKGFFEYLKKELASGDSKTADHLLPTQISFAFLDGDLYQSIKTSLELIWDRLAENAIVVVHDYNNPELPGVSKALEEWSKDHQFTITQHETLAIIQKTR